MRELFPRLFAPGTERERTVPLLSDGVLSAMTTVADGGWTRSTAQDRPRR